ncbi:MAG: methylmalonyl Co-A mutase-associated GTPase MeaB, partial [Planctomycetes bacterium]|nr:methylmalonyl Co-A mutase-associated GTPase MeaB [Planctomycetota bacterium]
VQAMKAGLLEVADLFCVNKADREGAERFAADLREGLMLALGPASREREIVLTAAIEDRGVVDLWSAVERARAHLLSTGAWEDRRRRRAREAVRQAADELRAAAFWTDARRAALERLAAENLAGRLSPWEAARRLAGDPDANPA